jgi:hypothetical protein
VWHTENPFLSKEITQMSTNALSLTKGQWIGTVEGTNQGVAALNLERTNPFGGRVSFCDSRDTMPALIANFEGTVVGNSLEGKLSDILPFDLNTSRFLDVNEVSKKNVIWPSNGTLKANLSPGLLKGNWTTDIGSNGEFDLYQRAPNQESRVGKPISWKQFRATIEEHLTNGEAFVYRGQGDSLKRLRTTFHRHGRNDLIRYRDSDVPTLHRMLSSFLSTNFDLSNQYDYGMLLNLAQHHGYPTPLLDWTESPYIAAFFAFEEIKPTDKDGNVKIFALNRLSWETLTPQVTSIVDPRPNLSFKQLGANHNSRALAQQSVLSFTNVDDIEFLIDLKERRHKCDFLTCYDLPKTEREAVLKELRLMGITAATLFPGVDGICQSLKQRYFEY